MKYAKISIIIPSFNQGRYIEESIRSVIDQHYPSVEILIMDAGSKDETVDVIHKYEQHIAYWQSRKDNGQSDAINQGVKRATGEFVVWLNSDDVMLPNSLFEVNKMIQKYPKIDWFLGNTIWIDKNGKIIQTHMVEPSNSFWNKRYIFSNGSPSAFMRRSVLAELGYLREDFHYRMDTEMWKRFLSTGHPFKRVMPYGWGFRCHEESKTTAETFENSPMADPNHPARKQMRWEDETIDSLYPSSPLMVQIWRALKLTRFTYWRRFLDKKLLGKHYSELN